MNNMGLVLLLLYNRTYSISMESTKEVPKIHLLILAAILYFHLYLWENNLSVNTLV